MKIVACLYSYFACAMPWYIFWTLGIFKVETIVNVDVVQTKKSDNVHHFAIPNSNLYWSMSTSTKLHKLKFNLFNLNTTKCSECWIIPNTWIFEII